MKYAKRIISGILIIVGGLLVLVAVGKIKLLRESEKFIESLYLGSPWGSDFPYDSVSFKIDIPFHEFYDGELDSIFSAENINGEIKYSSTMQVSFSPNGGVRYSEPIAKAASTDDSTVYNDLVEKYSFTTSGAKLVISAYLALYEGSYITDLMYDIEFYFWYFVAGTAETNQDESSITYYSNSGRENFTFKRNFLGISTIADSSITLMSYGFDDSLNSTLISRHNHFKKDGSDETDLDVKIDYLRLDSLFFPKKFTWIYSTVRDTADTSKTGGYVYLSEVEAYN